MAKEEEIPKHRKSMDAVIKSAENIDKIIDTVEHDHGKTYYDAAEEVLRDDKGQIDYKRLDPNKNGDKYHKIMAKKMSDKYLDKIVKKLKINPKDYSTEELDQITHGFFGTNEGILLDLIGKYGVGFTHEAYKKEHVKEHLSNLTNALTPRIYSHINAEEIPNILKDIGADKFIKGDLKDYAKPMFRSGAADLIKLHHMRGNISHKDIANNPYFSAFYKKPENAEPKYAVPVKKAA